MTKLDMTVSGTVALSNSLGFTRNLGKGALSLAVWLLALLVSNRAVPRSAALLSGIALALLHAAAAADHLVVLATLLILTSSTGFTAYCWIQPRQGTRIRAPQWAVAAKTQPWLPSDLAALIRY